MIGVVSDDLKGSAGHLFEAGADGREGAEAFDTEETDRPAAPAEQPDFISAGRAETAEPLPPTVGEQAKHSHPPGLLPEYVRR